MPSGDLAHDRPTKVSKPKLLPAASVGSPPGPAEYDVEGVTYLTPADQEALPYRIIKLLPWKHFGRKNVGYLYAVHHGAKVCSAVP